MAEDSAIIRSKSQGNLTKNTNEAPGPETSGPGNLSIGLLSRANLAEARVTQLWTKAHQLYTGGFYLDALSHCEMAYEADAFRADNLLLMGAIHFQLRNFSESIFYNQQCLRVDPNFAEGYSNLGNALKELGDIKAATQFYLKAIKLKPRYCDAYNNLASTYMQMGQTQEALETYQMALVLNPSLVDAHSNLGNLYKAMGDLDAAKRCYLEAIRIKPDFPIAWNNLAGVFKEEGQLASSVAYYREAIRLCPEFADAHSNLGNALKEQNQLEDALASYQTAVRLRPDFAIAHGNLGSCYYELGNLSQAIRSFKYAIQLEPNFPDAYNNLGNALREDGRLDEAVQCYRSALRLKPDHPYAYNNLGNALKDKGHIKESIHCYVTAVRLLPTFAAAHSNLGSVLKEQGKLDQALSHYHEAVMIDPLFADAYSNMGNVYKEMGQLEDSMRCYLTAIKLKPNHADAYSNLAGACKDAGRLLEAITYYRQALEFSPDCVEATANLVHTLTLVCDWNTRDEDMARLSQMVSMQLNNTSIKGAVPSVQPFHSISLPLSMQEMLLISERYSQRTKLSVTLADLRFFFRKKPKSVRLKVGYVSSDFANHPLSHLMKSVFGLHDKNKFEVTCYALTSSDQSSYRRAIENDVEHFKDISQLHSSDAAQLIANDGIHILINLNGYTKGTRNEIFALHPAPLQISLMGFCGTMGADFMDYIVADQTVIPPHLRSYYMEKVINMPHAYFVNDHKQSSRAAIDAVGTSSMPTRAQYGLKEDSFVFCNFGQLYKIDPEIFDVWCNILKRVPNAVLWLLRFPGEGEANLRSEAFKRGIRDDQIVFSDVVPKDEHLKRCYLADICLDTSLYNSHTTSCDILWSSTPMISIMGNKMAARVGASLLNAAGLGECVCTSLIDYEALAVSLAQDPDRLLQMRRHLDSSRDSNPLFDTKRWVSNFESGLNAAWRRVEQGLHPDHIDLHEDGNVAQILPPHSSSSGSKYDTNGVTAAGIDEKAQDQLLNVAEYAQQSRPTTSTEIPGMIELTRGDEFNSYSNSNGNSRPPTSEPIAP